VTQSHKNQLITKYYTGPRAGPCEHDNEPLCSVRGGESLDKLSDY
jgi:hypothetical protein